MYRQAQSKPMGINWALAWADWILRSFILQSSGFLAGPKVFMWPVLDNRLLIQPQFVTSGLVQQLQRTFLAHLPFECFVLGVIGDVQFLDLIIAKLCPPTDCTFFKGTNIAS